MENSQDLIPLIDGDIPAYQVASVAEGTYYKVRGREFKYKKAAKKHCERKNISQEELKKCKAPWSEEKTLKRIDDFMYTLIGQFQNSQDEWVYRVALTGEENFRDGVAVTAPYKGNRAKEHPTHLKLVRDRLKSKWDAFEVEGVEADDAVATLQGEAGRDRTVVCSTDKDLDMVPGYHYNWTKDKVYYVGEEEGYRNFWLQVLTGDRIDNIKGLPGVGPVKANKILKELDVGSYLGICMQKYIEEWGLEKGGYMFVENVKLLGMIQNENGIRTYCKNWEESWKV